MEKWTDPSVIVSVVILVLFALAVIYGLSRRKKRRPVSPVPETPKAVLSETLAPEVETEAVERAEVAIPEPAFEPPSRDLSKKLERTRSFWGEKLSRFWGVSPEKQLEAKEWEALEESLLEADVGFPTTTALLTRVKERVKNANGTTMRDLMREECEALLESSKGAYHGLVQATQKPLVLSIVGINGAGKTTTIGKLSYLLKREGKEVLLGACDTFRAGAIAQLKVWADRVGVQFVTGREGGDPGAVAFDSVTAGKARNVDVVILDTAGRLHTKTNLMDELKKVHRVIKKVIPEAPHETWLVIDGTLGQNSIAQAKEFQKTLDLTGVIVTKLDGTAKGGAILAINSELNLPVRYIGVGESMEDFMPFDAKTFVDAILG